MEAWKTITERRCAVAGCLISKAPGSGSLVFCFPCNEEKRRRWMQILGCDHLMVKTKAQLNSPGGYGVCYLHFESKHFATPEKKVLNKNAVPFRFSPLEDPLAIAPSSLPLVPEAPPDVPTTSSIDLCVPFIRTPKQINTYSKVSTSSIDDFCVSFIHTSKKIKTYSKAPTPSSLFHAIMNDEITVTLPNKFWSVSKVANESEPCIVFLKLIFSSNAVPVIEKQVVIVESLINRVFIHGQLISSINHKIISKNDITAILESLENSNVCRGIKNENVSKNFLRRKIAIVDNCNILRHKNCTITTAPDVEICIYCMSPNLQENANNENQSKIVGSKLRNIQKLNIRLSERLNRYKRIIKYTRENFGN